MHDKVYNRLSTESNIGSRKISMDELVFLIFFSDLYVHLCVLYPSAYMKNF